MLKIPLKLEVGKYKQSTHACETGQACYLRWCLQLHIMFQIKPRNNIAEKITRGPTTTFNVHTDRKVRRSDWKRKSSLCKRALFATCQSAWLCATSQSAWLCTTSQSARLHATSQPAWGYTSCQHKHFKVWAAIGTNWWVRISNTWCVNHAISSC